METMFVYCKFQVEGIHYWAEATNYLKHPHRHMFHFKVKVQTTRDRQIEFITLKQELCASMAKLLSGLRQSSCEVLARNLLYDLFEIYGSDRTYIVDVSEDGENGALVIYEPGEECDNEDI